MLLEFYFALGRKTSDPDDCFHYGIAAVKLIPIRMYRFFSQN
jgi:hypothetical protein